MDLDAYLRRIGHAGPTTPTRQTLADIVRAHAQSIPFENLNPFLGLPVSLEPQDLERKLLHDGRGGYCFEHNLLLMGALEAMGFNVVGLAARVLWTQPPENITPRTHMLLKVELDEGPHVVDVGFGGMTPTGVLSLEYGTVQSTPHEPFRLMQCDGDWWMQAQVRGQWGTLYRFDLQRQYPVDYQATNYYLSNSPASHFTTGLSAALPFDGGRYALRNRDFTVHRLGQDSQTRTLASPDELRDLLRDTFGLTLPDVPQLAPRLQSLFGAQ